MRSLILITLMTLLTACGTEQEQEQDIIYEEGAVDTYYHFEFEIPPSTLFRLTFDRAEYKSWELNFPDSTKCYQYNDNILDTQPPNKIICHGTVGDKIVANAYPHFDSL